MRRSEQFNCDWDWVDLERRVLTVPRSKSGEKRRVYLNDTAVAAFRLLWRFSKGKGKVFAHLYNSHKTTGARGWLAQVHSDAGIVNLHWHDLRHTFASSYRDERRGYAYSAGMIGHKTIQVTLRYARLAPAARLGINAEAVRYWRCTEWSN